MSKDKSYIERSWMFDREVTVVNFDGIFCTTEKGENGEQLVVMGGSEGDTPVVLQFTKGAQIDIFMEFLIEARRACGNTD
jgi:hypothetical protein